MKITWLGQAGLLFETDNAKVILDPYLSDSVVKVEPKNYRRIHIDKSYLDITPDFLVFTHNHLDHYDPQTAPIYLAKKGRITVLSPTSVYREAIKQGGAHNYVLFDEGTVWTDKGLRFTAVPAAHSDEHAIGVLIEELSTGKIFYITGDTLYSHAVFPSLPKNIYAVILPINGVGNNMNMTDAKAFAERVGARYTVPVHFGMFDELDPAGLEVPNKVTPEVYKEIIFPD